MRLWDTASGQCLAVIRDFGGTVTSVAWRVEPTGIYLVTGCADHSVRLWQVIEENGEYQVRLQWSSTHDRLTVSNTSIQDVQDLSLRNQKFLHQRGAIGEPSPSLNAAPETLDDASTPAQATRPSEQTATPVFSRNRQSSFSNLA